MANTRSRGMDREEVSKMIGYSSECNVHSSRGTAPDGSYVDVGILDEGLISLQICDPVNGVIKLILEASVIDGIILTRDHAESIKRERLQCE